MIGLLCFNGRRYTVDGVQETMEKNINKYLLTKNG